MESKPAVRYPTRVFAAGLNNPRGLTFGPDGFLYVAEGGAGGDRSTAGACDQVPGPIGPYTGGLTARISKINPQGERTTVVDSLPSDMTSEKSGRAVSGVADVAFVGDQLYALLAAGGCSHGNPEVPNGVIAVHPDGSWHMLADLSAFLAENPVANPDMEDYEPDGTWYSMISHDGALYAVDPHNGEVDRVSLDGAVSRLVDISASQGHIVPTAICAYRGDFYVGNLTRFPLQQGAAQIFKITTRGELAVYRSGLTNITGLQIDPQERMYVLESNVGVPGPSPDKGQVIRFNPDGSQERIVEGLSRPSAMVVGPDGCLYISNKGYGHQPGEGEIVRVEINNRQ